jgi:hypothetical protein
MVKEEDSFEERWMHEWVKRIGFEWVGFGGESTRNNEF